MNLNLARKVQPRREAELLWAMIHTPFGGEATGADIHQPDTFMQARELATSTSSEASGERQPWPKLEGGAGSCPR